MSVYIVFFLSFSFESGVCGATAWMQQVPPYASVTTYFICKEKIRPQQCFPGAATTHRNFNSAGGGAFTQNQP
jgi:hypothetical protein